MIPKKLNLVIYGAGAIGATLGGWLSQDYENIYLLTRGENLEVLKRSGLRMYELDKNKTITIPVKVIRDLNELDKIDIILITVKNYDLETVAKDISEKSEDNCIVVGLQNGVENQRILPKYFSKVLYGVLMISAWKDQPGVFGNTGKGRIVLGSLNIDDEKLTQDIANKLNKSFPTRATRRIQDAVHTKLALNLANSIFTIINSTLKEDDDIFLLWKIFLKIYMEGIEIVKAAGYNEHKIKGIPTWKSMEFAEALKKKDAVASFKPRIRTSWYNSMAQDVVIYKREESELETINGYLINLADIHGLEIPFNRKLYELCSAKFREKPFQPLSAQEVWDELNS